MNLPPSRREDDIPKKSNGKRRRTVEGQGTQAPVPRPAAKVLKALRERKVSPEEEQEQTMVEEFATVLLREFHALQRCLRVPKGFRVGSINMCSYPMLKQAHRLAVRAASRHYTARCAVMAYRFFATMKNSMDMCRFWELAFPDPREQGADAVSALETRIARNNMQAGVKGVDILDPSVSAYSTFRSDRAYALQIVFGMTGSIDCSTPEALRVLRSRVGNISPIVRILLRPDDLEIRRRYLEEAAWMAFRDPTVCYDMLSQGLDIGWLDTAIRQFITEAPDTDYP